MSGVFRVSRFIKRSDRKILLNPALIYVIALIFYERPLEVMFALCGLRVLLG